MARSSARFLILAAVGYALIGYGSAVFTNDLENHMLQAALRLVALGLGIAVFVAHTLRAHPDASASTVGAKVAAGAALGMLLLAVDMVLYNMQNRNRSFGSVAAVLVVWPLFGGLFAFAGASVLARVLGWSERRRNAS